MIWASRNRGFLNRFCYGIEILVYLLLRVGVSSCGSLFTNTWILRTWRVFNWSFSFGGRLWSQYPFAHLGHVLSSRSEKCTCSFLLDIAFIGDMHVWYADFIVLRVGRDKVKKSFWIDLKCDYPLYWTYSLLMLSLSSNLFLPLVILEIMRSKASMLLLFSAFFCFLPSQEVLKLTLYVHLKIWFQLYFFGLRRW